MRETMIDSPDDRLHAETEAKTVGRRLSRGRYLGGPFQRRRGRVGRISRSFDCQLEVVPIDLDLT